MVKTDVATNKDVVWALAKNIAAVKYADLPPETVEATKKSILDTLGVIEGASGVTPGIKDLVELVREGGGKEESTILGFGGKVTAWMAAFVNGSMSHCLDYDDLQHAVGHLSANTVPSGMAIAERLGKVSGKDFITAVALGNDLFSRLGHATGTSLWHKTPLLGVFAAAASSAKLLGLSEEQIVDALGLAFCQSAGTQELRLGIDSEIGGMRDAFPNKGGVLAALMAQRGIRGVRSCLEGKAGFFNVYFAGKYDRDVLLKDLGKKFMGTEIGFKPWPACGQTSAYIDCTLGLVSEHDIRPQDVEEITVFVGDQGLNLCLPKEFKCQPKAVIDAKYSIPFSIGVAVARRKVLIKDFTMEGLKDTAVQEIARKVTARPDKAYDSNTTIQAGKVEIKTKGGKVYSKHTDYPLGHPKRPIAWEDVANKFRDCVSYAAKPVPKNNVERVISLVSKMEDMNDVGQIACLIA